MEGFDIQFSENNYGDTILQRCLKKRMQIGWLMKQLPSDKDMCPLTLYGAFWSSVSLNNKEMLILDCKLLLLFVDLPFTHLPHIFLRILTHFSSFFSCRYFTIKLEERELI